MRPAGTITVWDTQLNDYVGVRNVRVVAKRWFKVERLTTDNSGRFTATKKFRNKVTVVVKFKNNDSIIRGIRGVRVWKILFPLQHVFGPISGNQINTFQHKFDYSTSIKSLGNQMWSAATINNAAQEFKNYASQLQIGSAPGKMKIFISGSTNFKGLASTPLFAKRGIYDTNIPFYKSFGLNYSTAIMSTLTGVLSGELDMILDYYSNNDGSNRMLSDHLSEITYHELSHACHYNKLGNAWYTELVNAEITESVNYHSGSTNPYGPGTNSVSPIIALGEGWAYHIGHFMADLKYGVSASCQTEQANVSNFCASGGTRHPHIDVLEGFNPKAPNDVFNWIPKGIMLDLIDDTPSEVIAGSTSDQVKGYTNQQFYNALQSDVKSIPDFRDKLLSQNNNNQQAQVISLFQKYGY